MRRKPNDPKRRGIVVILTAIFMAVLIPIVGLAIDASVLYVMKARLSMAADAAAIAAARSLSVGLTLADQEASARDRARSFFEANFPAGSYYTRNQAVTVGVAETGFRTRSITVNAAFDAPQYFMRYLGHNFTRVAGSGRASRRDVNLLLVLDRSGSMADTSSNGKPCTQMRAASKNFVSMFAEGRDRLGLITYSIASFRAFAPSMTFQTGSPTLPGVINNITCVGGTATHMAMWRAYEEIQTINEPGALNMIVVFTDGYPNAIAANYVIRDQNDDRWGYSPGYYPFSPDGAWFVKNTTTTRCSSTDNSCTMEPSPCKDGSGNVYDRNVGDVKRRYNAAPWNPSYGPNTTVIGDARKRVLYGVITQGAGDTYSIVKGATVGMYKAAGTAVNDSGSALLSSTDAPGCAFLGSTDTNPINSGNGAVRRDIAYMPDQEAFGNNTSGYKAVDTYPTGPYAGRKRIDSPKAVTGAGMNASDNAAFRIRNDSTLRPVIYSIGLGSNGGVDHEFMRRICNDPASPIHDGSIPDGMYAYAATAADLNMAFTKIASEILRLAQ